MCAVFATRRVVSADIALSITVTDFSRVRRKSAFVSFHFIFAIVFVSFTNFLTRYVLPSGPVVLICLPCLS